MILVRTLPVFAALLLHWCSAAGAAGEVKWVRTAVPLPESIWSVEALDVNSDGNLDVVAMGETKVFALLAPDWKQEMLVDTVEPKLLYCVALDADGDGDRDVALGRYRVPWIEYQQAREAGRQAQEPEGPNFSVAWIENIGRAAEPWPLHLIDRELNGIHGLWSGDIDGDGRKDLMADSIMGPAFPKSLVWFQTPGAKGGVFKRHIITKGSADGRPHYLDFADVNGDGRGDVLLGDSGGGTFTWWEKGGDAAEWKKHSIGKERGATNVKAAKVNPDAAIDVVGSCGHGHGVFWFEGPSWNKHVIDAGLASPHALAVGDFDKDEDQDVAVASFTALIVRWYENDGKGGFQAHDIDVANKQQAYDLKTADLDANGRLDLILAGRESRNAVIYSNR